MRAVIVGASSGLGRCIGTGLAEKGAQVALMGRRAELLATAAEEAGAKENPDASLHLKLANDQYDRATKMMKEGDGDRAKRMLDRASVDAELALELARLDTTRGQASDAMKSIDQLRKEHRMLEE